MMNNSALVVIDIQNDIMKLPEVLANYENKGCEVKTLAEYK